MGDKNPNKLKKTKKIVEKNVEQPAIGVISAPVRKPKK